MEKMKLKVTGVKYPPEKEDAGTGVTFYVITATADGQPGGFMAKGDLFTRPREGSVIEAEGEWVLWNGIRQFSWRKASYDVPVGERERLNYACELTKGLGQATAELIWQARGEDWRNVEPGEVRGLTQEKIEALRDTVAKIKLYTQYHDTIMFLTARDLSTRQAGKVFDEWQGAAIEKIKANPYELMRIDGIGFGTVDVKVRPFFDIGDASPIRLQAGMLEALRLVSEREGAAANWKTVVKEFHGMIGGIGKDAVAQTAAELLQNGDMVKLDAETVALGSVFNSELTIYRFAMT